MNHLVPNLIKQPGQCCVNCGKSYKKRENLTKHVVICDLLKISKKKSFNEDEEFDIPSSRIMYQMLIDLGCKYNRLEEQMTEMSKWVSKKKKKINVVEWLNVNVIPNMVFEKFIVENWLSINDTDIEIILGNSFYDTINNILSKTLFILDGIPIFAFAQKVNTFYIFQDVNTKWVEISRDNMVNWFNKIHMKFVEKFYSWMKVKSSLDSGDKFEMSSNKAIIKLMSVDFRVESAITKMKSVLFNGLKKEISTFEFTFEKEG
jgi:hypothetical protein